MFDISANTAVQIQELTFNSLHATDFCSIEVFTKLGTHQSFEEKSREWMNLLDIEMKCNGPETKSVINFSTFNLSMSDNLIIEANSTRAIYLHSQNTLRYHWTSTEDAVFVEDSHVQILEGTGLSKRYSHIHSPRVWCGILSYEVIAPESVVNLISLPRRKIAYKVMATCSILLWHIRVAL